MNAYRKSYVRRSAEAFGNMMEYATGACGLDGAVFLQMFISSGLADDFEHGNPKVVAGMSGLELAGCAIRSATGEAPTAPPTDMVGFRTPEFWAGWALAHYQWHSARSFQSILRALPWEEVVSLYHPLHEADVTKFYAVAEERYRQANPQTNLKRLREAAGLSQARLAEESGVSLRSVQMYEQRNKDVNKASAISLAKVARVLGCDMEDLLESEPSDTPH
ncbi:MAG: helix-turn-helix transcriptional regulator [Coriobacteriales bacterium]|jgi:DNA-binding transcriptional regulator YiaG|nr:helix-turn-helix transcriptional regulator [Coriobacteriales bacterium]